MSRGPGRIQKAVLGLITDDPHGAWRTAELCECVYAGSDRVEKQNRVAVLRALESMALPEPWEVRYSDAAGSECILYNACDVESVIRADWLDALCDRDQRVRPYQDFKNEWPITYFHELHRDKTEERRKYYSLDAVGRIDADIAREQSQNAKLAVLGVKPSVEQIAELKKRRDDLVNS